MLQESTLHGNLQGKEETMDYRVGGVGEGSGGVEGNKAADQASEAVERKSPRAPGAPVVSIIVGDSFETLLRFAPESFHACVCSPPYYNLRDYGTATWHGGDPGCNHLRPSSKVSANSTLRADGRKHIGPYDGEKARIPGYPYGAVCEKCGATRADSQIGIEETPAAYINRLAEVFREVRRVLRQDGTCWVVIGDSWNNFRAQMGPGQAVHGRENLHGKRSPKSARRGFDGCKEKDILGIPWMLAFALREDGWYLRQVLVYAKGSCMPESVHDRCTQSHEYILMLSKSQKYYFDDFAIAEEASTPTRPSRKTDPGKSPATRRPRSVWHMNPEPLREAHFAAFPSRLVSRAIQASTSEHGVCAVCGAPWRRIVEARGPDAAHMLACGADSGLGYRGVSTKDYASAKAQDASATKARILAGMKVKVTVGWERTCDCGDSAGVARARVLDCFSGAGTTMLSAARLGRDSTGIDLSKEYCRMAASRLMNPQAKCLDGNGTRLPYVEPEIDLVLEMPE